MLVANFILTFEGSGRAALALPKAVAASIAAAAGGSPAVPPFPRAKELRVPDENEIWWMAMKSESPV